MRFRDIMSKPRNLAAASVLIALSVVMSVLVKFPIIPAAPYLLYDPGDIPVLILGFLFGPLAAVVSTLILSVLMAVITGEGGPWGILMHFLATGALTATASIIYGFLRTKRGAAFGLLAGSLAMTLVMIPANLIVTPVYLGVPRQAVVEILKYIVFFNLLKAFFNSAVTFLVYKRISNLICQRSKSI